MRSSLLGIGCWISNSLKFYIVWLKIKKKLKYWKIDDVLTCFVNEKALSLDPFEWLSVMYSNMLIVISHFPFCSIILYLE